MATDPKRGQAVGTGAGQFKRPSQTGVVTTNKLGQYRQAPVGKVSIDDINYVPYGNVYERTGNHPIVRVATGGMFEKYTEAVPVPIQQSLMSLVYPPLVVERMATDCILLYGDLLPIPVDPLSFEVTLESGTLVDPLKTYAIPPETVGFEAELLSGTLEVRLLSYTIPPETVGFEAELLSGTLQNFLIPYSNWPGEPLGFDAQLLGGTLV